MVLAHVGFQRDPARSYPAQIREHRRCRSWSRGRQRYKSRCRRIDCEGAEVASGAEDAELHLQICNVIRYSGREMAAHTQGIDKAVSTVQILYLKSLEDVYEFHSLGLFVRHT